MAKAELTTVVTPKCQRLADEMGYELVDVCLDKENTGKFLRIYVCLLYTSPSPRD